LTLPGRFGPKVKPDFLELFRALDRAGVEHVVVGGVAAILEGAPIATLDLDIVYRIDDDNLHRLATLLEKLEARYRDPAGRDIRPTVERLASNKTNLLDTKLGPLDAMQRIGPDWSWAEVVERSHILKVGDLEVRVLELPSIIESKMAVNRDKDRAMLPVLRRTLEEK
jgi:hypothetical protein